MTVDTIFAPSTAIGGAIALIRVSGPLCRSIAGSMLDRDVCKTPRMLRFVRMLDGERVLDDGMACFLPGKLWTWTPIPAGSTCRLPGRPERQRERQQLHCLHNKVKLLYRY